ncbi:hypothetical protein CU098_006811, partial [Rhizopus stolonifer]
VDTCILYDDNELCILETFGKPLLGDSSEYSYDHIKVSFGSLRILDAIFKEYSLAVSKLVTMANLET